MPGSLITAGDDFGPSAIVMPNGMADGVIGIHWLHVDESDPTIARLEPLRAGEAQGDIYHLSIRPFLSENSLQIVQTEVGPQFTAYTFRFRHPWPIPADFNPPSTAEKRMDLFLFDVCLVAAIEGNGQYFGGAVKTNWAAVDQPHGFRQIRPFVNMPALGITSANTFPYKLVWTPNESNPAGNYNPVSGWSGPQWFNPSGYDVVPQGAVVDATMRIRNTVPSPVAIVTMAKYVDPRAGETAVQKRANRLPVISGPPPQPGTQPGLMYYLPEACGDIQVLTPSVSGNLTDNDTTTVAEIKVKVLDWDNESQVASSFPDFFDFTKIAERSVPSSVEVSIPELRATGVFPWSRKSASYGALNQFVDLFIPVRNIDQSFVAPENGKLVRGLILVRDTQDKTAPHPYLLKENQSQFAPPEGFEPSMRFQKVEVLVMPGGTKPQLGQVTPTSGTTGTQVTFTVPSLGGTVDEWQWQFGGGATPDVSSAVTPQVTLGAPGTYSGTVRAINRWGSTTRNFELQVTEGGGNAPNISNVQPRSGNSGTSYSPVATNNGGPVTSWSWHFGGGAAPNTSTSPTPTVTLLGANDYAARVIATGPGGESTFNFTLTVTETTAAPQLTDVQPRSGNSGTSYSPVATNNGGPVTSWSWHFGGGATPNTSTSPTPTVTLLGANDYAAKVTATGPGGESTFDFTLSVIETTAPPNITNVQPRMGVSGASYTPTATIIGGPVTSWSWNFGGGAAPGTSSDQSPNVQLLSAGSYSASVTATGPGGQSTLDFTLQVYTPCTAPIIHGISPVSGTSGSQFSPTASVSGDITTWYWDFGCAHGSGITPCTSQEANPTVTLGPAGTHAFGVVVLGPCGSDLAALYLSVNPPPSSKKKIGLHVTVIRSASGAWPTLWPGLSSWSEAAMKAWITAHINPVFDGADVYFDPAHITMDSQMDGRVYNLNSSADRDSILNPLYTQSNETNASALRLVVINMSFVSGFPGQTVDDAGSQDNRRRGAWVTSANSSGGTSLERQKWLVAHELGHVMNLPHICTTQAGCSPPSSWSANVMSYGSQFSGLSLSSWITRTAVAESYLHQGNPMNQYQVVKNWCNQWLPDLGPGGVPVISAVNFNSLRALRLSGASATASNSPTSWSWNFGGGAVPNTSSFATPVVTLGTPGTYNGTVTATNAAGSGVPFPFQFTVVPKMIGMRVRVITNGAMFPTRLSGMPVSGWSDVTNVNNWIINYINPIFINTGVQFDTSLTDFAAINNPSLFNIDNQSENNQLLNLISGQLPNRVNTFVINSQLYEPYAGAMLDDTCNQDNVGRGCYIVPYNSSFDFHVWPHEVGHVLNLPHIRTETKPITSANYNLMSYGTSSTALSSNIPREAPNPWCFLWNESPLNQFSVVNNWTHTHMQ